MNEKSIFFILLIFEGEKKKAHSIKSANRKQYQILSNNNKKKDLLTRFSCQTQVIFFFISLLVEYLF